MSKEIPMETGQVITVSLPYGQHVNYIRGKTGIWYPIATGTHPYLGSHGLRGYDFEVVGW